MRKAERSGAMSEDMTYDCPKHGVSIYCSCMAKDPLLVPDGIVTALLEKTMYED